MDKDQGSEQAALRSFKHSSQDWHLQTLSVSRMGPQLKGRQKSFALAPGRSEYPRRQIAWVSQPLVKGA